MKLFKTIPAFTAFLLSCFVFSSSAQTSDITITWGPESTTDKSPTLLDAWGNQQEGYMTLTEGEKDNLTITYLDSAFHMKRRDIFHLTNDLDPANEIYSFVILGGKHYLLYSTQMAGKDKPHRLMLQELNTTTFMRVGPPVALCTSVGRNLESWGYAYASPDRQKLVVTYKQPGDRKDNPGMGIICFGSDLKEIWKEEFRQERGADAQEHHSFALANDGSFYILDAFCADSCGWQVYKHTNGAASKPLYLYADGKAITKGELHIAADGSLHVFALWSVNPVSNYADFSVDAKHNFRHLASGIHHFKIGNKFTVEENSNYSYAALDLSKYIDAAAADNLNTNEINGGLELSARGFNSIDEESDGTWVVVTELGATEGASNGYERFDGLLLTRFSKNGDRIVTRRLPMSQRIRGKGDLQSGGAASISSNGVTWILYAEDVKTSPPPAVLPEESGMPQLQDMDEGRLVALQVNKNGTIARKQLLMLGPTKKTPYLNYFLKVDAHTLIGRSLHDEKMQYVRVMVP